MNFNQQRYNRQSQKRSFHQSSANISFCKENADPNTILHSSIIKEIQEIETIYQEKLQQMKLINQKLMSTIEFMEKTLEQQKIMLQEKQTTIMKQQSEIQSLRQMLSQNTQVNIRNLKTEIEDERIKTERLRYELHDFKHKIEKEKPLVQLFKKIEQTQEVYNQQNKTFMKEVLQILDKPRSLSQHRQSKFQKKGSFYI